MKRWYPAILVIIPMLIYLVVTASRGTDTGFDKSRELTALRQVGHQLLLTSGDSTSRVLPVRELSQNEFFITFEKAIRLQPDSLVSVFRKIYPPSRDYAVELREVGNNEVLYSFVLSPDSAHTIVPCTGRIYPAAHYAITLRLPDTGRQWPYFVVGVLVIIAAAGIWWYKRKAKPLQPPPHTTAATTIPLGKYHFSVKQQRLEWNGSVIELTGKEAQLLKIFALSPNIVVERSRLLKEVWEDEGVIVTRSLDMFISKLRKKLEGDPGISLVNVHGKGYRLDVALA